MMDLVVPGMADLKDSRRNVKFSTKIFSALESVGHDEDGTKIPANDPNTLLAASFSRKSWRVISWIAILSSV